MNNNLKRKRYLKNIDKIKMKECLKRGIRGWHDFNSVTLYDAIFGTALIVLKLISLCILCC